MPKQRKNADNSSGKSISRLRLIVLAEFAIIVIAVFLYVTKPAVVNNSYTNSSSIYTTTVPGYNYQAQYNQLLSSLQNPDIVHLASNKTITVPGYSNNTVFYNSTYGLYNNYTIDGQYNITFKAPYDGYLILYVQKTNAPVETFGISSNSNSSAYIECYGGCKNFTYTSGEIVKGLSGFTDTPADNTTFYHFYPVLRGQENFSFDNGNRYPISITYSLTYIGDNKSNLTPLTINYSN